MSSDEDEGPGRRYETRSEISGSAAEVVQARDVHGGVHFHSAVVPGGSIPRQLPGDVGSFVNRGAELARLTAILADDSGRPLPAGVFVIAGTAGVGKTSLALHWAHMVKRRFPDGQLYVNLRGYDPGPQVSPEQVLDRFLRALGVRPNGIPADLEDRAAMYRSLLGDRRMLVLLDNAATVRQVRPLLPGNAESLVLVTSRSRLSGLVARDGARRLTLDMLSEADAVQLLQVVTSGYRAHDDARELAELARLCARLPLALRIAAERASSRPLMLLTELITDLRDESALWDALTAEDDEEADAVRTVFAWSYRALPEEAARLFRLLGLHPGPEFGVPVAAALADVGLSQARQLLDVLVGAHVLEQHAQDRYQFHDLLRAYATDQALQQETSESRHAVLARVVAWYLNTADAAVAAIAPLDRRVVADPAAADVTPLTFPDRDQAIRWYEQERANLVATIRAAAEAGLHRMAWQLPAILREIYMHRNPFEDWIATGRIGLESARLLGDRRGEAELLESLGMAFAQSRKMADAEDCHRRSLDIRREIGDRFGEAVSVNALGLVLWRHRRLRDARSYFERGVSIARGLGERRWEALFSSNLGMVLFALGSLEEATQVLRSSLTVAREHGDRGATGNALFHLAAIQREQGQLSAASSSIEDALDIARDDGNLVAEGHWLLESARIQMAAGGAAEALTSYQRAAVIQRRLGDRNREAMALDGTGQAYRDLGALDEAAKFHRGAALIHRELDDRWQLAIALDNLATVTKESGDSDEARSQWNEIVALLSGFDDPRADEMRDRARRALSDAGA